MLYNRPPLIVQSDTYTTHLPTALPSGDYLIRHEILALHLGNEPGGAEFYPSCTQVCILYLNYWYFLNKKFRFVYLATALHLSRLILNLSVSPERTMITTLVFLFRMYVSLNCYSSCQISIYYIIQIFNPGANYTSFPGPAIISPFFAGSSGGVLITGKAPSTDTIELPGASQTPTPFTNVNLGVVATISVPGAPTATAVPTSTIQSSPSVPVTPVKGSLGAPSVSPSCKKAKKRSVVVDAVNARVKRNATAKPIKREDRPKVLSRIMARSRVGSGN